MIGVFLRIDVDIRFQALSHCGVPPLGADKGVCFSFGLGPLLITIERQKVGDKCWLGGDESLAWLFWG